MKLANSLRGFWPVAQRELREAARRKGSRRMRFWGAGAAIGLLSSMLADSRWYQPPVEERGEEMFLSLHTMLAGLIFLVAPCLTADCLAREKRDGTLGLLFLTPLSAAGVVAGKAATGLVRAFTLSLAVAPVLMVPFLAGGITRGEIFVALSGEFCLTTLCLAGGLLASSFVKNRNVALFLGYLFSGILIYLFALLFFCLAVVLVHGFNGSGVLTDVASFFTTWPITYISAIKSGSISASVWGPVCCAAQFGALAFFGGIFRFAGRHLERSWQDKAPSVQSMRRQRRYFTPVFRKRYRRAMRRSLDWNPISWLQQYSWKSRITKWGLCFILIVVETAVATCCRSGEMEDMQTFLLLALTGTYLFVGVNSFLQEKTSGALELLLISPVSVNRIIFGRAWGLWKQFAPATFVVLAVMYWPGFLRREEAWVRDPRPFAYTAPGQIMIVCTFLSLPVFATYAALRKKNLFSAAALALLGPFLSLAFAYLSFGVFSDDIESVGLGIAIVVGYVEFSALTCLLLRHSLSRRIYCF